MNKVYSALISSLLLSACLRPTRARAERDLEVGSVDVGGVQVRVADGLATVRNAEPGSLSLWLSAPTLRIEVDVDAAAPPLWRIELQNCLADLELLATGPGGAPLGVTELAAQLPTQKTFDVELVPGAVELRLATPDEAELTPWRFAVMSDVQEAIDDVQDIYAKVNGTPNLRYLLGAGDLTRRGSDGELARFQRELELLDIPYYTTLGNHELGQGSPPPYQDWFGRGSFSYTFRDVRFSMLDSASAMLDPLVYEWLDTWLLEGKEQVHVVAMHVPPIDPIGVRNGSFASRNEAAKLLKRLADGGVDLTLYGHIHSYYSFENAGIPAYVSGGGGAIPERFDNMGRHFLVVSVEPQVGIQSVEVVRVD
jgi:3',5'-cyclic-AMP phosphodiesterase